MLELIGLELKRNNIRSYIVADIISCILLTLWHM